MKITFASYEHTCLGFPQVILKWCVDQGTVGDARVVVKGLIQPGGWTWHHGPSVAAFLEDECQRFDAHVRATYADDASVQG